MKINDDDLTPTNRLDAFNASVDLVAPIVEQHGLKEYRTGQAFGTSSVYPPAEQHLNLITNLAEWLLGDAF